MSDELFSGGVISLDCEYCEYCEGYDGTDCACECGMHGGLTVRQKEKHFMVRRFIEVPTWNEDTDFFTETECKIL